MKIGWGWLGRLIFGVISLTISVLASCYCSVVICGDQINYQKIKQISCICQPAVCVCDCRPVWICVEKIKVYICFHYFMNRLVYSYSSIYREREREARTGQDRTDRKTLEQLQEAKKNFSELSFWRDVLCHVSTSHNTLAHPFAWAKLNARMRPLCALDCGKRPGYPVTRSTGWSLSINAEYVRNDVEKLFGKKICKNDGITLLCIHIYIYTGIYRLYSFNESLSGLLWCLLFHEVQLSNIKTSLKHNTSCAPL